VASVAPLDSVNWRIGILDDGRQALQSFRTPIPLSLSPRRERERKGRERKALQSATRFGNSLPLDSFCMQRGGERESPKCCTSAAGSLSVAPGLCREGHGSLPERPPWFLRSTPGGKERERKNFLSASRTPGCWFSAREGGQETAVPIELRAF